MRIAIDDFGTGYSSLNYLRSFPVDTLKIAKAFVDELGTSPEQERLVAAILRLGTSLGLETVAEGIEDRSQRDPACVPSSVVTGRLLLLTSGTGPRARACARARAHLELIIPEVTRVKRFVAIVALGVLAIVPVAGGTQAAAASLATLLARHAPILILHPAERFRPVPVEGFLADSDLQQKTATAWEKVNGPLPAGGADLRLDQRLCRAVEGVVGSSCYADAEAAHGGVPVAYGAAFRTKSRIALQYWLWYPFNDYSPTIPPSEVWQVHEGDWESVSVILDLDGRPVLVALSRHCDGTQRPWATAPRRLQRPLVYVALGSHANYFGVGAHPHSPACWPRELRDIVRSLKLVDHTGAGRTMRPRLNTVTSRRPGWMRYAGRWGEDGYLHFASNDPIAYPGSPRGPAFHEQWRAPVKEPLTWPRG